jgi:Na+/phosphate symporter
MERLAKVETEIEDLQHQITNFEKKIAKKELEKKTAAS